jgi:hypothetical protein
MRIVGRGGWALALYGAGIAELDRAAEEWKILLSESI